MIEATNEVNDIGESAMQCRNDVQYRDTGNAPHSVTLDAYIG